MSFWCHRFDQNSKEKIVRISAWGLPWSFLLLLGNLVSYIINKEAYRKPQRNYKNFQGRKIYVAILVKTMTPKKHFEINWPLVLNKKLLFFSLNLRQRPNRPIWKLWDGKKLSLKTHLNRNRRPLSINFGNEWINSKLKKGNLVWYYSIFSTKIV